MPVSALWAELVLDTAHSPLLLRPHKVLRFLRNIVRHTRVKTGWSIFSARILRYCRNRALTPSRPQSRLGDKTLGNRVVCPQKRRCSSKLDCSKSSAVPGMCSPPHPLLMRDKTCSSPPTGYAVRSCVHARTYSYSTERRRNVGSDEQNGSLRQHCVLCMVSIRCRRPSRSRPSRHTRPKANPPPGTTILSRAYTLVLTSVRLYCCSAHRAP